MANMFFLSPDMNFSIKHLKATVKFDNEKKGQVRFALRFIVETTEEIRQELKLLILIKNEKKKLKVEDLEDQYNERFYYQNFRDVAGAADRFSNPLKELNYVQFTISEFFKEYPELKGRCVLYPRSLECRRDKTTDMPEKLRQNISDTDIIIEVIPGIFPVKKSTLIIFQLAIVLEGFVEEATLSKMRSSGKLWSVNFDFHEKIGYQDLFDALSDNLTYPEVFELWIYIPKGHYPIASSPFWERVFNLGIPETQYKITGKRFETDERDIAVKLINKPGETEKFSIVCISPYIGEEQLAETEEKIRNIREKIEDIPSWRDFLQNMLLTVALFSLLIGAIVILAQQAISWTTNEAPVERLIWQDFPLLVEISVFVGFSIWGIFASLKAISEKLKGFDFLAYIGAITLGILGLLTQFVPESDLLKYSITAISLIFIGFGFSALLIRIRGR